MLQIGWETFLQDYIGAGFSWFFPWCLNVGNHDLRSLSMIRPLSMKPGGLWSSEQTERASHGRVAAHLMPIMMPITSYTKKAPRSKPFTGTGLVIIKISKSQMFWAGPQKKETERLRNRAARFGGHFFSKELTWSSLQVAVKASAEHCLSNTKATANQRTSGRGLGPNSLGIKLLALASSIQVIITPQDISI